MARFFLQFLQKGLRHKFRLLFKRHPQQQQQQQQQMQHHQQQQHQQHQPQQQQQHKNKNVTTSSQESEHKKRTHKTETIAKYIRSFIPERKHDTQERTIHIN